MSDSSLRAIGFWDGPETDQGWPDVHTLIDPDWDAGERDFIVDYVSQGVLGRHYMGFSTCRVCGKTDNGNREFSDGTFVWPSGLSHYIEEHAVRLPAEFVIHAYEVNERLVGERDESWWRTAVPDWSLINPSQEWPKDN